MSELNVVEPRELTSVERRVLNNVSMEQNANVKLGVGSLWVMSTKNKHSIYLEY